MKSLIILVASITSAFQVSATTAAKPKPTPVRYENVVLAVLDGSSETELNDIMKAGHMPNLSLLAKHGSTAHLHAARAEMNHKSLWSEILIGHGVNDPASPREPATVFEQVKAVKKNQRTVLVTDDPLPFVSKRHHRKSDLGIHSEMTAAVDVLEQKAPFKEIAERAIKGIAGAPEKPFYALLDFNLTTGQNKYDFLPPHEHQGRILSADHELGQLLNYFRQHRLKSSTAIFVLLLNSRDIRNGSMVLISNVPKLKTSGHVQDLTATTLDALNFGGAKDVKTRAESLLTD